jgi:hypothetical protein
MLSWFRARTRGLSAFALVSLTALTLGSAIPHREDHHGGALDPLTRHDPNGHAVRSQSADEEPPLHCVLCHLTRAFRRPDASTHLAAPIGRSRVRALPTTAPVPHRHEAAQPPLRAPPSHL